MRQIHGGSGANFSVLLQRFNETANFAVKHWRFSAQCGILTLFSAKKCGFPQRKNLAAFVWGAGKGRTLCAKMERRCTERGEASVKKRILLGLISVFKALYNAVYAVMKLRPMQKKVVMISRQSNSQRPDFEQLGAEIEARDPGVRLVYLCREMGDTPLELLRYCFHLLHCAAELSTAHVCIIDGYCIPVSVLHHRKELRVVQVWHALGAIKKFGRQALSVPGGRDKELAERMGMHKHYDAVLCASHRTAKAYEEAFGVSADKMRVTGVPRVDAILKMNRARCRRRFFAAYPELRGQKIVLYAPTFRDGEQMPEIEPLITAAEKMDMLLIVRLHPLDRERLERRRVLPKFRECPEFGTFTLMAVADAVITDYSAISIEASLIKKPVYFYVYDLERYKETRGLNFDPLAEMPHCAFTKAEPLVDCILHTPYDYEKLTAFRKEFVETDDTNNTQRCVDLIMTFLTEGINDR